jgi:hypothetical protein
VGKPVASVRRGVAGIFSIPDDAQPFVGGSAVDGQYRLRAGDSLEFLNRRRRKGGVAKNTAESKRAGNLIRAKKQACYLNAFRVIQEVPGYRAATYVEGMVVQVVEGGGFPFEHGWVEKDGEIIDPTLPAHELVYFPGLRFVGVRGLAEALAIPKPDYTTEDFPFFYRFGWGGADNPEFSQARREAYRLAFGEPDKESRSPE